MSEEQQATQEVVVDAPPIVENPAPVEQAAPQINEQAINDARELGWKPKEEYKGDPERWVPADKYLELTEKNPVFYRRALNEMKQQAETVTKAAQEIVAHAEREKAQAVAQASQAAYQRAMQDIAARTRAAVESGDVETVDKLTQQRDQINIDFTKAQVQSAPQPDPYIENLKTDFIKRNSWYTENLALRDFADRMSQRLAQENIPPQQQLERIETSVKQTYPHLFQNQNRQQAPMVNPPSNNQPIPRSNGEKTYTNLNAEGKRACDQWVQSAMYLHKNNNPKVEDLRARWLNSAPTDYLK